MNNRIKHALPVILGVLIVGLGAIVWVFRGSTSRSEKVSIMGKEPTGSPVILPVNENQKIEADRPRQDRTDEVQNKPSIQDEERRLQARYAENVTGVRLFEIGAYFRQLLNVAGVEDQVGSFIDHERSKLGPVLSEVREKILKGASDPVDLAQYHDRIQTIMATTDGEIMPVLQPMQRAEYMELRERLHSQLCFACFKKNSGIIWFPKPSH